MSHDKGKDKDKDDTSELKRQLWEPAGVVSVVKNDKTSEYTNNGGKYAKGGILSLEVEEVFHNKGIMEGTQLKD